MNKKFISAASQEHQCYLSLGPKTDQEDGRGFIFIADFSSRQKMQLRTRRQTILRKRASCLICEYWRGLLCFLQDILRLTRMFSLMKQNSNSQGVRPKK